MAVGEPSRSRCAFGESDGGEGQALALRFGWKTPPRSEQDQAILLYRGGRCMAASVVRDRLIAKKPENRENRENPASAFLI